MLSATAAAVGMRYGTFHPIVGRFLSHCGAQENDQQILGVYHAAVHPEGSIGSQKRVKHAAYSPEAMIPARIV
jgi:hypothetical protein